MIATVKVFKWDDDLAIEIPQELIDRLALKEGDEIEIVEAVLPQDGSIERQD